MYDGVQLPHHFRDYLSVEQLWCPANFICVFFFFRCNRLKAINLKMGQLKFYYVPGSAPCRAVQMTAKAVGVELDLQLTNLMAGEHLKPEFIKVCVH